MKPVKPEVDYTLEKPLTDTEAFFTFKGNFQDSRVTWHVKLQSIHVLYVTPDNKTPCNTQTIEIEEDPSRSHHFHAVIKLNLSKLTTADIIKTMIMLKQYKNLSIGSHHWGTPGKSSA